MKTSHAWSLIVAFAFVLMVWLAVPASARAPVSVAVPDASSGSVVTLDPIRPPSTGDGPGSLFGTGDNDGDPDDIMGGNNVVKGTPSATTQGSATVTVYVKRTLSVLLRAWWVLAHGH